VAQFFDLKSFRFYVRLTSRTPKCRFLKKAYDVIPLLILPKLWRLLPRPPTHSGRFVGCKE
jgi:hypothetical protein